MVRGALRAAGVLLLILPTLAARPALAADGPHGHHDRVAGASATATPATTAPLTYNGGSVMTAPKVYLTFWGSDWSSGFTAGGYSSTQAQSYLSALFSRVGGTTWAQTDVQYCQGVASGSTSCPAGATAVGNQPGELVTTWVDGGVTVPASPTGTDVSNEAARAAAHFGHDPQGLYFVLSPTGKSESGFGTQWCGYHGSISSGGSYSFTYLPYMPDAGSHCGEGSVNTTFDAFGHGYFDGYSLVGGHEYAESVTDPFPNSGWIDSSGQENGDKCQWQNIGNATLGDQSFAMQPLWSNAAGGCVMSTAVPLPPPPPIVDGGGTYHPLAPARVIDTRRGLGMGALAAGQRVEINLQGSGGVPSSGATAVVLNVTAADAAAPGFLALYPGATAWPGNSSLNFGPGSASTNAVEASIGHDGGIGIANGSQGSVDVIIDVMGWVDSGTSSPAGRLHPVPPARIFDTRSSVGGHPGPLAAGTANAVAVQLAGTGNVPPSGATAAVLNVTVTNPAADGFLAVYPSGTAWPGNSNVNFAAGQTLPNRVLAPLGPDGRVMLVTSVPTDVIVDVGGWFTGSTATATTGGAFNAPGPARLLDTRSTGSPVAAGYPRQLQVTGVGGVPASGVSAVALNVTATDVSAGGFIAVNPDGAGWQVTSDLNTVPGVTSTNLVIVKVGSNGMIDLANSSGTADLIVDLVAWYS